MTSALCPHNKQRRNCKKCRKGQYYITKAGNRRDTWTCDNCGYRQNLLAYDKDVCHRCRAARYRLDK